MENIGSKLILEKLNEAISPAMADAITHKLTLRDACKKAGIPYSLITLTKKFADIADQKSNQKILLEIRELATQLVHDMKKIKERTL